MLQSSGSLCMHVHTPLASQISWAFCTLRWWQQHRRNWDTEWKIQVSILRFPVASSSDCGFCFGIPIKDSLTDHPDPEGSQTNPWKKPCHHVNRACEPPHSKYGTLTGQTLRTLSIYPLPSDASQLVQKLAASSKLHFGYWIILGLVARFHTTGASQKNRGAEKWEKGSTHQLGLSFSC